MHVRRTRRQALHGGVPGPERAGPVAPESAILMSKAISKRFAGSRDPLEDAAQTAGLGQEHFRRWVDWTSAPSPQGEVVQLPFRTATRAGAGRSQRLGDAAGRAPRLTRWTRRRTHGASPPPIGYRARPLIGSCGRPLSA
jgi:hypothetical protein